MWWTGGDLYLSTDADADFCSRVLQDCGTEESWISAISAAMQYIIIVLLVVMSGIFSGLSLGLMSLDRHGLEIDMEGDNPQHITYSISLEFVSSATRFQCVSGHSKISHTRTHSDQNSSRSPPAGSLPQLTQQAHPLHSRSSNSFSIAVEAAAQMPSTISAL
uniref:Uncharacterized protein n=1 Tax=Attheya septentrionalis TaxID=420275 RepID=A0A6T7GDH8_9STRA